MTDKEKFIQNCIIAYDQIMEAFDKKKHLGYTQLYASISEHRVGTHEQDEYQIQLMFNSDKEAWVHPHTVGFCVAFTSDLNFDYTDVKN